MLRSFQLFAQTKPGLFIVLALAAWMESYGDSCFQDGLYKSAGLVRVAWFAAGTVVLVGYSLFLNSARVDFGKLLGLYVVLFFLMAQLIAFVKYGQRSTGGTVIGGLCIVVGGVVMVVWR